MIVCPGLSMHSKLEEFCRDEKYCDVSILVQGRTFKCHRVILAAASSYFDRMFCGNFRESYVEELQLHDINSGLFEEAIDSTLFEKILQNIYCGKLDITEDNAFNLLRISEFLSIQTVRDPCIEFIIENQDSLDNVVEIFLWARRMNILLLIEPLLERISRDFISLSENAAFLELSFEDLRAALTRRSTQSNALFEVNDLIVDALVRWLHHSYTERRNDLLGALIPRADLSIEYLNFLSEKYRYEFNPPILEDQNTLENEQFFRTYITSSREYSADRNNLLSVSFADSQFSTNHSSIYLYLKGKIFSINKYKPDGFIPHVKECHFKSRDRSSLITSSESDLVYCIKNIGQDDTAVQSFCAYSSIDLSESNSQNLRPPPVFLQPKGALDERNKCVYFAWTNSLNRRKNILYEYYSHGRRAFTDEELKVGVFRYDCERDEWFIVPQMKSKKEAGARPVVDHNLVYYISIGDNTRMVQAYDIRSSQRLKLPDTINTYRSNLSFNCCVLNGKIYVGGSDSGIEVFDPTMRKWEILTSPYKGGSFGRPVWNSFFVPYENMLWHFKEANTSCGWDLQNVCYSDLSLQVYKPNSGKWYLPHDSLLSPYIIAKCGFENPYDILDYVIVSNC